MNTKHLFFRHYLPTLSGFLLLLAVLSLAGNALADPEVQDLNCPKAAEIRSGLALKKEQLSKLKTGLEAFLNGEKVEDIQLSALFMIDLGDAAAIARRVAELKRELTVSKDNNTVQEPLLACAAASAEFKAAMADITLLQQMVSGLRLQFLTLPPEKMAAILHPQLEATAQADTVKQLQEERSTALVEQQQAVQSIARVEQQALTAETGTAADLLAERGKLERVRGELTALQVTWVSDLERQVVFYKDTSETLAAIAKFLLQPETAATLKDQYGKAMAIWRTLVDKTDKVVSSRYAFAIPALPDYPDKLLGKVGDTPEAKQYVQSYADAKAFREALQDKIGVRLQETIDLHYRVLLQSGEIRSQLLNLVLDHDDNSPLAFSTDLFQDIRREFTIVPYRWSATFYLRILDVRNGLSQGWQGFFNTVTNIGLLLVLLLMPWAIWIGTQRLTTRLNQWRVDLVRQSRLHPSARRVAVVIQKILPYSSWLLMLAAMYIAQELLVLTVFSELALLLPYIRYYIYYRLFRQMMQCDFLWISQQIKAAKLWDLRHRVDVTAKTLGISALLVFSLLSAIEGLIRRGLIYHLATLMMLYLGILIVVFFAYQWRVVIAAGLAKLIPGLLGRRLSELCAGHWGLVLAIPGVVALVLSMLARQLGNWGKHFELTKRIAAELFRYQLESAIEKKAASAFVPAPTEYRQFFTLAGGNGQEQLLQSGNPGLVTVRETLANWAAAPDTFPNSLAITGYKGAGKTCLLDYLQQNPPIHTIFRCAVPAKLTERQAVLDFFSDLFKVPDSLALQTSEMAQTPSLVLIDDAHNLFLAKQGGFGGYQALLELIDQAPRTLFWCLTFNYHAWNYLNSVYHKQYYFGTVARLMPWTEAAVQELVLSTHALTDFRLSYDDIIQAVGSQANSEYVTDIENRFFSLLRQQSRGNPRLAIYLWLSSLRSVGAKSLQVGLPDDPPMAALSDLPDDGLFVLASIARHENLTLSQAVATTRLPSGVVKSMLDKGVHLKLLECDGQQIYRLAILCQYPLINYLQAKHCLYE
ncbi:MAG: hypothetical protein CTY16_19240 [Methylobacter sp.]|nr:MAG: hypothetical protein CTY16_19240 [Methylobacter sp.]